MRGGTAAAKGARALRLAGVALLGLWALGPARAQEPPAPTPPVQGPPGPAPSPAAEPSPPAAPDKETLLARYREFLELEARLLEQRRAVRVAGEEVEQLADRLSQLRAGRTPDELRQPPLRDTLQELLGRYEAQQRRYAELDTGDARQRRLALQRRVVNEYAELVREADRLLAAGEDLDLRLMRGRLLAGKERFDLARRDAEAVLLERPQDPDALLLMGKCLTTENRFEEAFGLFQLAREARDDDASRAYCALGAYCLNRFAAAREARAGVAQPEQLPVELRDRLEWWLEPAALERLESAWDAELAHRAGAGEQPRVELHTGGGVILLELDAARAPNTAASFLDLVGSGFMDGLAWHRVVPNLMAQSGDPATREGAPADAKPGFRLRDELGTPPRIPFRGSLVMARGAEPDSAASQFFLTVMPVPALTGRQTVCGWVVSGQEVLDRLRQGDRIEKAVVVRPPQTPRSPERLPE